MSRVPYPHQIRTGILTGPHQILNRLNLAAADPSAFSPELHDDNMKLRHAVKELTERAHRAGVLRTDVTWRDIVVLSLASVNAGTCLGVNATDTQPERTAAILLTGLRAHDGASPLPGEPPVDLHA